MALLVEYIRASGEGCGAEGGKNEPLALLPRGQEGMILLRKFLRLGAGLGPVARCLLPSTRSTPINRSACRRPGRGCWFWLAGV